MKKIIIILLVFSSIFKLFAQSTFNDLIDASTSTNKWHYVKKDISINSNDLLASFIKDNKVPSYITLKEFKTFSDSIIGEKIQYLQYFYNIKIEDSWISYFEKNAKASIYQVILFIWKRVLLNRQLMKKLLWNLL